MMNGTYWEQGAGAAAEKSKGPGLALETPTLLGRQGKKSLQRRCRRGSQKRREETRRATGHKARGETEVKAAGAMVCVECSREVTKHEATTPRTMSGRRPVAWGSDGDTSSQNGVH